MAKVSHVHLFGISFIFFLTGAIFSLCELKEGIKIIVISTPFAAMFIDIASWWLTHYHAAFAYTVIIGGALISITIPIQVFVPIYQIWIQKASLQSPATDKEAKEIK